MVIRQVATWEELNTYYSVDDAIKLGDALDIADEVSEIFNPQLKGK